MISYSLNVGNISTQICGQPRTLTNDISFYANNSKKELSSETNADLTTKWNITVDPCNIYISKVNYDQMANYLHIINFSSTLPENWDSLLKHRQKTQLNCYALHVARVQRNIWTQNILITINFR